MKFDPTWKLERLFWTNKVVNWADVMDVEPFKTNDGIAWTRKVIYRTPSSWGDMRYDVVTMAPYDKEPGSWMVWTLHEADIVVPDQPIEY